MKADSLAKELKEARANYLADEASAKELEKLIDLVSFCARTAHALRERLKGGDDPDNMNNVEDATVMEMVLRKAVDIVETNSFIVDATRQHRKAA